MIKELVPQFLSALIIICAIIVVSQLVRLSEVLVTFGISVENVFLPFLFIILPFVSLTIPMAYLFAVVLTYGRLSADGEYAALLAAGYPLRRSAVIVLALGGILYGVAAASSINLEAWGRRELVQFLYRKSQTELDNMIKYKLQSGVFLDDFLGYVLYAEQVSQDHSHFENVLLAPGGEMRQSSFTLLAPSGHISGSVQTGDLRLTLNDGMAYAMGQKQDHTVSVVKFNRADIDLLRIFREQIVGADAADDDYRSLTPRELRSFIAAMAAMPHRSTEQDALLRRAHFLWHQRIAAPFSVITFALFGMVLGVADPRRGKSTAYVGAILTIMVGYVLMMAFKNWAEMGAMPVVVAAWVPNLVLGLMGSFLLYQKNRLPPSEGTLDLQNLTIVKIYQKTGKNSSERA